MFSSNAQVPVANPAQISLPRPTGPLKLKECALIAVVSLSVFGLFPRPAAAESEPSKFTAEVTRAWMIAGSPYIEGKTNLPEGDGLQIQISTEEEGQLVLENVKVSGKQFRSGKCEVITGESLLPGRYIVEITPLDQDTPGPIYVKTISISDSRKIASSIRATDSKTSEEIQMKRRDRDSAIEDRAKELLKPIIGERLEEVNNDNSLLGPGALRIAFRTSGSWEHIRSEMRAIYGAIFNSDLHVSDIIVAVDGVDQSGQLVDMIYATRMNKSVAKRIDWKDLDLDFTKLWTTTVKEDLRWTW